MDDRKDPTRQLVELAVSAGRARQSPQTGFIHYCYQPGDEEEQDTIPLYENFLYALALFRLRTVESIQDAKDFLTKLCAFQNLTEGETQGNFPIYLHEFPQCKERFQSVHILAPLFWIFKEYTPVLGNELKQILTDCVHHLLNHAWKSHLQKAAPFQVAIKLAAVSVGFGELWKDKQLTDKGTQLLDSLKKETEDPTFGSFYSPSYLGETLTALQIAYPSIKQSPWKEFLETVQSSKSPSCRSFAGPAVRVFQKEKEPILTIYDLYVHALFAGTSYRAFQNHPIQLQGALVHPFEQTAEDKVKPVEKTGIVAGFQWVLYHTPHYSYSALQKTKLPNPSLEKGFHPFYMVWGDSTTTETFVCQGGNPSFVDFVANKKDVELIFDLAEPLNSEEREKNREIVFYVNQHQDVKITVAGQVANTFQMDQEIILEDRFIQIKLVFQLESGDGRFMGHINPANRPSQVLAKGKHRFSAYDTAIGLRTVRRFTPCRVRVKMQIKEVGEAGSQA